MNKVILKTAIITAASLALAALLVFSLWILCSPQSMATVSERTGNYSFAITCADLRYKYTKDAGDLARCAEDSILAGKDKLIVKYGEKLIADEGYENLCAQKDEKLTQSAVGGYKLSYNAFLRGNLAAAQYRTDRADTEKAIRTAVNGGDQSFIKLVIEVSEADDKDAAQKILDALDGVEDVDGNLSSLKNILNTILN